MGVEIRRGSARFNERGTGRATWHSFSFGSSYDPENLGFGALTCHDDHWLANGAGFETHRHNDLAIVTWVVSGALTHTGPDGTTTVSPGQVAVLHAGSGVEHSEVAAAPQTRFVQVWLTPDEVGDPSYAEPSYAVSAPTLVAGELVEVARPTSTATLHVAHLDAGQRITVPAAPLAHVFVARGALTRSSMAEPLEAGDVFRFTDEPEHDLTAAVPTELLVWTLTA